MGKQTKGLFSATSIDSLACLGTNTPVFLYLFFAHTQYNNLQRIYNSHEHANVSAGVAARCCIDT
jgi:hypothetical protein